MTRFALLFAALLIPNVILAGPKTLEDYRNIYVAERAKIDAQYSGKSAAAETYIKALANAKAVATKNADVDTGMAVMAELKRFKDFGDLTTEAPAEQPTAIKQAQAEYNAVIKKNASYRNAKIVSLSQKYIAGLKGLTTKLMKAEDFASAKAVSDEIKLVEAEMAELSSSSTQSHPVTPSVSRAVPVRSLPGKTVAKDNKAIAGKYDFYGWQSHRDEGNSGRLISQGTITLHEDGTVSATTRSQYTKWVHDQKTGTLSVFTGDRLAYKMTRGKHPSSGKEAWTGRCLTTSFRHLKYWVKTHGSGKPAGKMTIPSDARAFDGHHYKVFESRVSWHEAKQACEKIGGHLVTISSERENRFVSDLTGGRGFWIGLTDEDVEGNWKWVDGTRAANASWVSSGFEQGTRENYAIIRKDNGTIRWLDNDSNGLRYIDGYVCEWDK